MGLKEASPRRLFLLSIGSPGGVRPKDDRLQQGAWLADQRSQAGMGGSRYCVRTTVVPVAPVTRVRLSIEERIIQKP